jgi:GT2 family glycosyltransferase
MKPEVSIIIPVRNNLHYTKKCLESIAASSLQTTYEIIVVDNESDDGTKEFLEEKAARGELQVIRNDPPQSFAVSCNRGAEKAAGDYLVFLNNDIEAFPGWLDAMMRVVKRDDRVGAVGAKLLFPDGTIQHAGVGFHYFRRMRRVGPYHIFRKFPCDAVAVNKEREYRCVTGACLLTPRRVFMETGKFDERFINCFEDVDYCLRLYDLGYKIIYTPEAELIHYEGQTAGRRDSEMISYQILQEKWNADLRPDDWNYFQEEGFVLVEDNRGELTVQPGKELQKWWTLILELEKLGEYRRALDEVKNLEKVIGSQHRDLFLFKGRCHRRLKDHRAARLAFSRAAAVDAESPEPKLELVQIALEEGKRGEALRWLQRLIRRHSGDLRCSDWRKQYQRLRESSGGQAAMSGDRVLTEAIPAAPV